ncbi:MAG: hypothetical protein IIA59_13680 [Candidatus Marinimicrobia bacterium]|nr:hypothetical protein [Candidatus Neomarinimicrobiota bacterium]
MAPSSNTKSIDASSQGEHGQAKTTETVQEAIPPVFDNPRQRHYYEVFPHPPIDFPVTPGETDNFPRNCALLLKETLKGDHLFRKRYYRAKVSEIARNARRPDRDSQIFIIKPDTMDSLLNSLGLIPSSNNKEVRRVLWVMYYQGLSPEESDAKVNGRTLARHLTRAERMVGVLPEDQREKSKIGLPTVKVSYQVMRLGRDGNFDIQPYFEGKIF